MTPLGRLAHELRLAAVALQFLSRIPVPPVVGFQPEWLHRCVRHFPLAGALIGAAGAAVLALAHALWPPLVAATLAVAFSVWLTAAFHEDGLADTFDALLGAAGRERALVIMKDSRIGSYGAAALVLTLLARVAAVAALLPQGVAVACAGWLASHVLARAAAVVVMTALPYAGDAEHAKAKPLALDVRGRDAAAALLWCTGLWALPLPPARLLAAVLAAAAVAALMVRWLRRRLGGYTGDTLGATEQLAEVAVLLAVAAHLP